MIRWIKIPVFLVCLVPLGLLAWKGFHGMLGANPIEVITHATGDWTMRFLLITLAVTPLRKLLGTPSLIRFRRMFGLYAFFYGCLHFMTWLWLDKFFDWHEMWADILKRRFITVGMLGLLLLLPLAITSTAGWIRRLGGKRWNRLHKVVYLTGILGPLHYWWLVKADVSRPLTYAAVVAALLGARIYWKRERKQAIPARVPVTNS